MNTSLIVSLASLLVSVYTFWVTRVAKFKLNVVATARVELTSNPQSPGAKQPGIIMQLLFSNRGAHLGYVHDAAMSICKVGSKSGPVLFRSLYEHVEESLNLTGKLPPPKLLAFTSFPVEPGETVVKKVVFVPVDSQVEFNFEQGTYLLAPYTRVQKLKWKKWDATEIEINEDDLHALGKTEAVFTGDGSQFVKWLIHSKPTKHANVALQALRSKVEGS